MGTIISKIFLNCFNLLFIRFSIIFLPLTPFLLTNVSIVFLPLKEVSTKQPKAAIYYLPPIREQDIKRPSGAIYPSTLMEGSYYIAAYAALIVLPFIGIPGTITA